GERLVALDDLEQGLLLAEQVLLGTGGDRDGEVAEPACLLDLGERGAHPGQLWLEAGLPRDVRLGGADRVGGGEEALEHRVGVRPEQRPVLDRARLTLRGVADGVAPGAAAGQHGAPLDRGGEPGPAPAPQAGPAELVDRGFGAELERAAQAAAAPSGDVLVERRNRRVGEQAGDGVGGNGSGAGHDSPSRVARGSSMRRWRRQRGRRGSVGVSSSTSIPSVPDASPSANPRCSAQTVPGSARAVDSKGQLRRMTSTRSPCRRISGSNPSRAIASTMSATGSVPVRRAGWARPARRPTSTAVSPVRMISARRRLSRSYGPVTPQRLSAAGSTV